MISRDFKVIFLLILFKCQIGYSQNLIKIKINTDNKEFTNEPVEVYDKNTGFIKTVGIGESFEIKRENSDPVSLIFISINYPVVEKTINPLSTNEIIINLPSRTQKLSEVVVNARKKRVFELRRLKDFEGTSIYSGKKSEVISINESMANLAIPSLFMLVITMPISRTSPASWLMTLPPNSTCGSLPPSPTLPQLHHPALGAIQSMWSTVLMPSCSRYHGAILRIALGAATTSTWPSASRTTGASPLTSPPG